MPVNKKHCFLFILVFFLTLLAVVSCSSGRAANETPTPTLEPTPTEAPMAARVNGEGILQTEYEAELQRYQTAVTQLGEEYDEGTAKQEVMDELVDQTLLAQAAAAQNFSVDDAALQSEMDALIGEIGGAEALQAWYSQNFYTDESFRSALKRNMAASWMVDKITAEVPAAAEQVHARQILVDSQAEAEELLRQLQAGTAFEDLAYEYDSLTGGELGWFPRGYLLQQAVEDAAFSVEAGGYSGVISTSYGYHLIEVIEKDAAHQLSPDALMFIQRAALNTWLENQRTQSAIEVYVQ